MSVAQQSLEPVPQKEAGAEVPQISIIIPYLHEGEALYKRATTLQGDLAREVPTEVLLVSDSGRGQRYPQTFHGVRSITMTRRIGKGGSIKNAIGLTQGKALVYLDADFPVSSGQVLGAAQTVLKGEADLVVSQREKRELGTLRRMLSIAYNDLAMLMFRTGIRDHQAGFKVVSKTSMSNIEKYLRTDGFVFDTELIVWARRIGLRVKTIDVNWNEEKSPLFSTVMPVRAASTMFIDLFILKLMTMVRNPSFFAKVRVGIVLGRDGERLGDEQITILTIANKNLLGILRTFYATIAFRKRANLVGT